jgi:type I restriction enzyme M protein
MITGELKSKMDALWNVFWTGGLTNPLDVIEQITYLMYIKDLDDADNKRSKDASLIGIPYKSIFDGDFTIDGKPVTMDGVPITNKMLSWSAFRNITDPEKAFRIMRDCIFPFIKNLDSENDESAYSQYMADAIFKIPTPQKLSQIVDSLDSVYEGFNPKDKDIRGDVYEYLLMKLSTSGTNGQFRTPRHIIKMMVKLMSPTPDDIILDPAAGTSGFLVASAEYLSENYKNEIFHNELKTEHYNNTMFTGYDMDRTMLRIGAMNMMCHGVEHPHIEYKDSLSEENEDDSKYTLILTNPPFKGSLDESIVAKTLNQMVKTKKTELLFMALFIRSLKIGGRCAAIVPDGVLFGSSKAHKDIRKAIIDNNRLEAVISMPSGVFKPYAGVSTAILIFTKTEHGGTDNVWFYDMQADGFSLDDKRSPIADNDIPDIIARFKNLDGEKDRQRTEKSFLVPVQEIRNNDYDLSINKYKKTEYKKVEYPPTKQLLKEIRELDQELNKTLDELDKMLE